MFFALSLSQSKGHFARTRERVRMRTRKVEEEGKGVDAAGGVSVFGVWRFGDDCYWATDL